MPRSASDGRERRATPVLRRRAASCCLRFERVGDLVMVLEAIAMVRALAPDAAIDLIVGSWNRRSPD